MNLRKHASLVVTAVLAAALLTYAYVDRNAVTDIERTAREGDLFPAWRRDQVTRFELVFPDETLTLDKHGDDGGVGTWAMTQPRNDQADYASVESLLISLEHGRPVRKSSPDVGGWDKPRARGKISMGAITFDFEVGAAAPTPEGASYFRLKGQDPVVISKEVTEALLAHGEHYRSRAVVPYLSLQLDWIEVTTPAGPWKLTRLTPIAFKIEPLGVRASRVKIDRVWGALADLRSEAYFPTDDARRLTESPVLRVAMKPTEAQKAAGIVRVGGPCPGQPDQLVFYREAPDPIGACVPKGAVERLSAPPDAYVDEGAFSYRFDEIEDVILTSGDRTVELARIGSGFHMRAPEDRALDVDEARVASHLLTIIDKTEGASFVRGFQTDEPALGKVRVRTAVGDEEIEVGRAHIRRLMDGAVLSASETLTAALLPRRTLLRAPRIFAEAVDASEISQVTLDCGALQIFERDPKNPRAFVLLAPPGFAVDEPGLHGLAENLTRLRADAWVADEDRGAWKTKTSSCKVSFRSKDDAGAATHTLSLGAAGQGGIFARVDDDPAVAVVPTSVSDLMHAIYIDTELRHPPGALAAIEVKRNGKTETRRAGDAGMESREAFAQLESLAFDRVLHLGEPTQDDGMAAPALELELTYTTDAGASAKVRLALGAKTPRGYTAVVSNARAVFLVSPRRLGAFFPEDARKPTDAGAPRP